MRRGPKLATKVNGFVRAPLIDRLHSSGVCMLTKIEYEKITEAGVVIRDENGESKLVEADTVVLAAGAVPNIELLASAESERQVFQLELCSTPKLSITVWTNRNIAGN